MLWGGADRMPEITQYIQGHPDIRLLVSVYVDGGRCRLETRDCKAYLELRANMKLGLRTAYGSEFRARHPEFES
jgi:hypothetical protein